MLRSRMRSYRVIISRRALLYRFFRDYMDRLLDETESAASSRAATPLTTVGQSEREDGSTHNGEHEHILLFILAY